MSNSSASTLFSCFLSSEYHLFSVGHGAYNAHGHENNKIFPIKQINNLVNIKMISCYGNHSICLTNDGDILSFGRNNKGQLGIGKSKKELEFTHIPQKINLPPCKQVSCGEYFSMCLTEDNILYSFGDNYYGQLGIGQLGLGNDNYYNSPQLIPDLNNIEYIECGGYHSICKTYDNEYYYWGDNYFGQLGHRNNKQCNKPIQCLNWPDNITDIKCGLLYTLILTSYGQVYSFGDNGKGQLGINDNIELINKPTLIEDIPEIQRIECGKYHTMCIDINNNIWFFGNNEYGQLGLGDTENRYKPILHPTLSNIIDILSGGHHTFVKTIENKIYAFGYNNHSQLGIKTSEKTQLTPIQVLEGKEDIWCSFIGKSKAKSARK